MGGFDGMKDNYKYISCEQIKPIKNACRIMYNESRTFPGTIAQKDIYLNTLIDECFKKGLIKVIQEDDSIDKDIEEISKGFLLELKELMEKWKEEFSLEFNKDNHNNNGKNT